MGNSIASPKSMQTLTKKSSTSSKKGGQITKQISFDVRKQYVQLIESALSEEHIQHIQELQDNSRFWNALEGLIIAVKEDKHDAAAAADDNDDEAEPIFLNERDWGQYVVNACRIYIQCGLSDEQILSILSQTIVYVAVCALRAGHRRVYFDDGVKVFFDPCEWGMPNTARQKYEMLLERVRGRMMSAATEWKNGGTLDVFGGDDHDRDHDHDHGEKPSAAVVQASSPRSTTTVAQTPKLPIPRPSLSENQSQQNEIIPKPKKKKKDKKHKKRKSKELLENKDRDEVKPLKRKLFGENTMSEHKKPKYWRE